MAKYELTRAQYKFLLAGNHDESTGTDPPINLTDSSLNWPRHISWKEMIEVSLVIENQLKQLTGHDWHVRPPHECEWEYAAMLWFEEDVEIALGLGTDGAKIFSTAWFLRSNVQDRFIYPVGKRNATPPGIYDLFGNAHEWVLGDHEISRVYDFDLIWDRNKYSFYQMAKGGGVGTTAESLRPSYFYPDRTDRTPSGYVAARFVAIPVKYARRGTCEVTHWMPPEPKPHEFDSRMPPDIPD